jgi:hypothetical protein
MLMLVQMRGRDYYVDSVNGAAANAGAGDTWAGAKITLAAAVALATAGDRIHVAPGHSEVVATAGAITISKSGLTIIGYGYGNQRPLFTWSGTAATIAVSGNDNVIANIRCTCSIDEVVSMWNITGARVALLGVDYNETAACQAIQFLTASAAAVDFVLANCRHRQETAAAANSLWIAFIGAGTRILDNTIILTQTSSASSQVLANGTAAVGLEVSGNRIIHIGAAALAISLHASSTGAAFDNRVTSTGTLAGKIALGGAMGDQNFVATTANKNGILDPVVA